MGYLVYILRCGDGTLYTGCTNDLPRRLQAHQSGRGAKYTRSRLPVELDDIHDRDSALRLHQIIRERLTTREAEIIRLRYGLGGTIPLTQREIAASFGISRSYVSRIEKRALEKLRQELQDGPAPQLVRRRPHSSGT